MKTPDTPFQKWMGVLSWLGLAAMAIFVGLRWPSLPEQMPLHYNFAGEIDRWGSRLELLVCPLVGLLLFLVLTGCLHLPQLWNMAVQPTADNRARLYSVTKTLLLWMRLEVLLLFGYLGYATTTLRPLSVWFLPVVLLVVFGTIGFYVYQQVQLGRAAKGVVYIDSEVTRLKNTFPVAKWWLLGPLMLTAVPFLYLLTSPAAGGWFYALLLAGEVLPFCGCYFSAAREKSTFFTGDARRNLALNRLRVRGWSLFWVLTAYNAAIFGLLCFMLLQANDFRFGMAVGLLYGFHVLLALGLAAGIRCHIANTTALLLNDTQG